MAQIDEINEKLQEIETETADIREGLEELANKKGVSVIGETPKSLISEIDNHTVETPTATINITTNGEVDVTNYATANVNVVDTNLKGVVDGTSSASINCADYGITTIKAYAFYSNTGLKSVDLTGVTSIGSQAFYNCSGLTSIYIPNSVTSMGTSAFDFCRSLTNKVIGASSIPQECFINGAPNSIVVILDTVTSIGKNAFASGGIIDLTIGKGVKTIGQAAFQGSYYTNAFKMDSTVSISSLGSAAFEAFGAYVTHDWFDFDFRNSTFTSITYWTFGGGTNNHFRIKFPATFTSISGNSNWQSTNYMYIYYNSTPTLSSISNFSSATNFKNFFLYNDFVSMKSATNWSDESIISSIFGYAPENTFATGDTLPTEDSSGNALTWYSDEELTTTTTTVDDGSKIYYCTQA